MEKENHDSHAKQCNSELSIQSSVTTTSTICSNSEIIDISEYIHLFVTLFFSIFFEQEKIFFKKNFRIKQCSI